MFLAHRSDIHKDGVRPLAQCNNKFVLFNTDTPYMQSNVCPHQKSLISTTEQQGIRVCPYHGLSFNADGTMIVTERTNRLCPNHTSLTNTDAFAWRELIFSNRVECEDLDFIDFKNFSLVEQRVDTVNSNFKNVMDLFLDVDHIPIVHSGVYDRIGFKLSTDVIWKYYSFGNLQLVKNDSQCPEFADTLLEEDKNNPYGAAWLAIYPGTMIEWQPGALFITVATNQTSSQSKVHVFKYRDNRYNDKNWKINEEVWELAWKQDRQQAELLTEFNQDNLEKSKQHYRDWLHDKQMEQI
jgi:phenylpropionate dioxygenase-like ring-hydroxylating dioxygenase large terminal subunit